MQAERDHLVRFVFPRLRVALLARRIHLVDVDLRWGVPSEQDASEVCREIIDECRPWFLCMLGGRYGWTPPGASRSITADEVHYAAIERSSAVEHCFFYFRDPKATAAMEEMTAAEFREPPGSENERKLIRLKQEIVDAGCRPFLYPAAWDPRERRLVSLEVFGDQVYADLLVGIDSETNAEPRLPDDFAEESASMDAFVEERVQHYVVGSRGPLLAEMQSFAEGRGRPNLLALTSAPGLGKSALLAWFYRDYAEHHPRVLVIPHFVGASLGSGDLRCILRRLCRELSVAANDREGTRNSTSDDPSDAKDQPLTLGTLIGRFSELLHHVAARQPVVVVIDALDRLDAADDAQSMRWLPTNLPENVRVIVSSLVGPALLALQTRAGDVTVRALERLEPSDARTIIANFLRRHGKSMPEDQLAALQAKPDAGSPVYLLAALEELRTLGTHAIDQHIRGLPGETRAMFAWILRRLESEPGFRDSQGHLVGPDLVRAFASRIAVSRAGLGQGELEAMLAPGDPGHDPPIPNDRDGNVAALIRLLRPYLAHRGRLLDFFHSQFREAVEGEYLSEAEERRRSRQSLIDFFLAQPLWITEGGDRRANGRKLRELPWQLSQSAEWDELCRLLADPDFFVQAWEADEGYNRFEVKRYWAQVEASSIHRMTEAYRPIVEAPSRVTDSGVIYQVARLFADTGHVREALPLIHHVIDECKSPPGSKERLVLLSTLAAFLLDSGEFDAAMALDVELAQAWRRLGGRHGEAVALLALGAILRDRGELHRALRLMETATELLRPTSTVELADCLGKRADVHSLLQEYHKADRLLEEKESLERQSGNDAGLAHCLNARGIICLAQGRLEEAFKLNNEEERLCASQGDRLGLQRAIGSKAVILTMMGSLAEALRLADAALDICVELANPTGLAFCHGVRGRILRLLGRYQEARREQETEESLARASGNRIQVGTSLIEQAITARQDGRTEQAKVLWARGRQILGETDLGSLMPRTSTEDQGGA